MLRQLADLKPTTSEWMSRRAAVLMFVLAGTVAACSPTVKVEAPDKPIVINLNVKIEQEVRIKVDRDVDSVIQGNPSIF
ncbi:MAG: YnbE family lipoprotein [Rhodospirillaceae bacterium]|nr:YnbE family lipoprotein [Rhodospirillaceae bacterium]